MKGLLGVMLLENEHGKDTRTSKRSPAKQFLDYKRLPYFINHSFVSNEATNRIVVHNYL